METIEPGIYKDISLEKYHSLPGWSKSSLDHVSRSMAHWEESKKNKASTPAMVLGSAIHCAILTPEIYETEFAVLPQEIDRRTRAGKDAYADFICNSLEKTVIDSETDEQARRIADAFKNHPTAPSILSNGVPEQSAFWIDPRTGLLCKTRPDYMRNDCVCVDIKTTDDARPEAFARSILKYNYHVQAAMALDGLNHLGSSGNWQDFVFIVIEKLPPYAIGIYRLDTEAVNVGREKFHESLTIVRDYTYNPTKYPGYSTEIQDIYLPKWAY